MCTELSALRFSRTLRVLVMGLAVAISAYAQVGVADPPMLRRVDLSDAGEGKVRVALICDPVPASFSLEAAREGDSGWVVFLPGYRSQAPFETPGEAGQPQHQVTEENGGVHVAIRGRGFVLQGLNLERTALTFLLVPTAADPGDLSAREGPSNAASQDDSYHVGPGDLLDISVFGHEDLSKSVRVLSNGTINFPLLGGIPVTGMTPAGISQRLVQLLEQDYVVKPQVLVGVSEYISQPVNVIGEVQRPGKYYLKGPTRLIDILSEAGGLTGTVGSVIIITRYPAGNKGTGTPTQIRVPMDALSSGNHADFNVPLRAGDVVHPQPAPVFYIRGEVGRPGQYPLRTETTLQKAISLAGGFSQWADERDVQVIRGGGGEKKQITVNVKKIAQGKSLDLKIEPEDIIVVSRRIL